MRNSSSPVVRGSFGWLLLAALLCSICTQSHAIEVIEKAGFQFTLEESFLKSVHPGEKLSPETYFDVYGSPKLGFGVAGQAWRVADWETVVARAIEKTRSEMPFNFIGDTVQLHDQSDSGEPITIIYARTDNEKVPVFFFFSFKTAPHAWIVYFVGGRSKLPADYLGLAKR